MGHHCIPKKLRFVAVYGPASSLGRICFDRHVTVNGNRYRSMITEYFWSQLDDMDFEDMWFQQNVATSNTANVTNILLETKFGERVISRNSSVG